MARKKIGHEPATLTATIPIRASAATRRAIKMYAVGKGIDMADMVYEAFYEKWKSEIDLPEPEKPLSQV